MKEQTHKPYRRDHPARLGQAKIKKVADQRPKQVSEPDPAHQPATGPAYDGGNTAAGADHCLADLVWTYLSEEITQAIIELQEDFAARQAG